MNGFFRLVCEENSTYLQIMPPTDGGNPVGINEVMEYLNSRGVNYDSQALYTAVNKKEPQKLLLNRETHIKERENYKLVISPDNMQATIRFYPPSEGGELISRNELVSDLGFKGIKFGIQDDAIDKFFRSRAYCEDIVVAVGKPPRHGSDARIEYFFSTDVKARPTLKEDGSVDFFHLNTINHCQKGDVLAQLYPEDVGEIGRTILGEPLKPRDVRKKKLKFGRNITLSEDKLTISSDVDGHVTLVDDKVFVSDVLTVENVDNSTGNIEYEGSVQVSGNVCANFSVIAKGNIEVGGVVEGAYLQAGGDIIIARGMNGMGRGELKASGNIVAKFMENATAMAKGYVSSESILHSSVQAGDEVTVSGRRGFITGGRVCALNSVSVKTLGSSMGADTVVEVGVDPTLKFRIQEIQKEIAEAARVVKSVQPLLTATQQKLAKGIKLSPDQIQYMKSLIALSQLKKKEVEEKTAEMESMQDSLGNLTSAAVNVTGVVFPGTKICIGDSSMVVHGQMQYCKFIRTGGEVKMTAL